MVKIIAIRELLGDRNLLSLIVFEPGESGDFRVEDFVSESAKNFRKLSRLQ